MVGVQEVEPCLQEQVEHFSCSHLSPCMYFLPSNMQPCLSPAWQVVEQVGVEEEEHEQEVHVSNWNFSPLSYNLLRKKHFLSTLRNVLVLEH